MLTFRFTSKGKITTMGAGLKWTDEENMCACKSFVFFLEDSKRGIGQKSTKLESRVLKEYERMIVDLEVKGWKGSGTTRSAEAVVQRYKVVKRKCLGFEHKVQLVLSTNSTGNPSDRDIIRAATTVENSLLEVGTTDRREMYRFFGSDPSNPGKPFKFLNCYLWLRNTPFWQETLHAIDVAKTAARASEKDQDSESKSNSRTCSIPTSSGPAGDVKLDVNIQGVGDVTFPGDTKPVGREVSYRSRRPGGAKLAIDNSKTNVALTKGADGLHRMVAESRKRNEISERLLKVEERNYRINLFQIPGTDPILFNRFRVLEQQKVIAELTRENSVDVSIQDQNAEIIRDESISDGISPVPVCRKKRRGKGESSAREQKIISTYEKPDFIPKEGWNSVSEGSCAETGKNSGAASSRQPMNKMAVMELLE